jgi:pimeloyl-ACP methyl ester carboxylesterase
MTSHVTSKDGTTLAVDSVGQGTPVILVGGAFNDRSTVAALGAQLASRYRVVTYDRRGRGASDDKGTGYSVQNEIDDLAAVIEHAGGGVSLFGHSSGGILMLEAVLSGLPVDRIAVYEPSYVADPDQPRPAADVFDRIEALVAAGDRDGAAELFLGEIIGVPGPGIAGMRASEAWSFLTSTALSLPYDVLVSRPWELIPAGRLAAIDVPLLAVYGNQTMPGLAAATKAVAQAVPGARLVVLEGEDHGVLNHPEALAPTLIEFFS